MDRHANFNSQYTNSEKTEEMDNYTDFTAGPHGLPLLGPVEPPFESYQQPHTIGLDPMFMFTSSPSNIPLAPEAGVNDGAMQNMSAGTNPAQQARAQEDEDVQPFPDNQMQELRQALNHSENQTLIPVQSAPEQATPGVGINNTGNPFGLFFTSNFEAASHVFRREVLILINDDVAVVEGNAAYWVHRIMLALKSDEFGQPPDTSDKKGKKPLDESMKARWINWQENAYMKLVALLNLQHGPHQAEARAWRLFNEVTIIHATSGTPRGYRLCPFHAQLDIKCSERLEYIIENLQRYTILRHNLVNDDDHHFFAVAPDDFADQRIRQMWSNYTREGRKKVGDATINSRKAAQEDGLGRAAQRTMTKAETAAKKKELVQQKKAAKRTAGDAFEEIDAGESDQEGTEGDKAANVDGFQLSADAAQTSALSRKRMRIRDL